MGKNGDYTKLRTITAPADERISAVLQRFYRGQKHAIIVVRDGRERATLDENELLHAFFSRKASRCAAWRSHLLIMANRCNENVSHILDPEFDSD